MKKKYCTYCKNKMTTFINGIRKKDGVNATRTTFHNCSKCKKLFCGYCVISASSKVLNGKIQKMKKFPPICLTCSGFKVKMHP